MMKLWPIAAMVLLIPVYAPAIESPSLKTPSTGATSDAADAKALARTQAMIGVMQTRLGDLQVALKRGDLEPFFDFAALCDAPIDAHKKALSAGQKVRLKKIFAQLVRQLAYAAGAQIKDGTVKLAPIVRRDASGRVLTDLCISHSDEDVDSDVSFVWVSSGKEIRIVDVNLDGASIVKDYENQFSKIIGQDGAEGLITKIQTRLKEAEHKVRIKGSAAQ